MKHIKKFNESFFGDNHIPISIAGINGKVLDVNAMADTTIVDPAEMMEMDYEQTENMQVFFIFKFLSDDVEDFEYDVDEEASIIAIEMDEAIPVVEIEKYFYNNPEAIQFFDAVNAKKTTLTYIDSESYALTDYEDNIYCPYLQIDLN